MGAVSGGGDQGAAGGGGSSRPGRVTALGAGPGRAGERFPRVSPFFSRAFSPGPGAQGRRARWVVKRDWFSSLSIEILSLNRSRCALVGQAGEGTERGTPALPCRSRLCTPPRPALGGRARTRSLARSAPAPPRRDSAGRQAPRTPRGACLGPPPCGRRGRRVGSSELGADPGRSPRKHRRRGAAPPPPARAPRRRRRSVGALCARTPREPEPRPRPPPGRSQPAAALRAPLRVHSGP